MSFLWKECWRCGEKVRRDTKFCGSCNQLWPTRKVKPSGRPTGRGQRSSPTPREGSVRGKILHYSFAENTGVISGDDENRYNFQGCEWRSEHAQPRPGLRVDFLAQEGRATAIYVDVAAPQSTQPASRPHLATDDRYNGVYRSSDDQIVMGLCAGIAHKHGSQVGLVRAGMFILTAFVLWFPYLVAFFVPEVPTRGVPRPHQ